MDPAMVVGIMTASMAAKEIITLLQTNPNPTESQIAAVIASQLTAVRDSINTIHADMAKYAPSATTGGTAQ